VFIGWKVEKTFPERQADAVMDENKFYIFAAFYKNN
jgi:hypothetical protein